MINLYATVCAARVKDPEGHAVPSWKFRGPAQLPRRALIALFFVFLLHDCCELPECEKSRARKAHGPGFTDAGITWPLVSRLRCALDRRQFECRNPCWEWARRAAFSRSTIVPHQLQRALVAHLPIAMLWPLAHGDPTIGVEVQFVLRPHTALRICGYGVVHEDTRFLRFLRSRQSRSLRRRPSLFFRLDLHDVGVRPRCSLGNR